jgi:hypothetical protein
MRKNALDRNLLSLKSLDDLIIEGSGSQNDLLESEDIASEKTWDNLITLETFSDWISVASYKIECLDLAIKIYR